jgi:hypothetical protein
MVVYGSPVARAHLAAAQTLAKMEPQDLFDLAHERSGSGHLASSSVD